MESTLYNSARSYLKTTKLLCLITVLFASITSSLIWAHDGHGGGHHFGGHIFGGYHFGGGHHHFGEEYHHYGHHYNDYGIRWALGLGYSGYYSPYYGGYGPGYGGNYPPVIHIQREDVAQADTEPQVNDWHDWNEWHWCSNPEGYYPYVKKCLNDWIPVAPKPSEQ